MVVAQDLRLNFGGKGQRKLSCRNGIGESDGAESPDARIPGVPDGKGDSARVAAWTSSLSIRPPVEQAAAVVGNRDASLSVAEPGIDADVRRGHSGRDACPDSDDRRIVTTAGVPAAHIPRCNTGCRDHSGCRYARGCGSRRTGSVVLGVPLAVRANGVSAGDACVMTYFVRNVVPGRRGLRGAASELAWRLGPVSRLRFHRPVSFLLPPQ